MYHIFYQAYEPRLLCTFRTYEESHEVLSHLEKRYPSSRIWIEAANILTPNEFFIKHRGVIIHYEHREDVEKVDFGMPTE